MQHHEVFEKIERAVTRANMAAVDRLTATIVWGVVGLAVTTAFIVGLSPKDDTDPADGRSGLQLHTDARTGCQYLSTPSGGITARLDSDGRHICE